MFELVSNVVIPVPPAVNPRSIPGTIAAALGPGKIPPIVAAREFVAPLITEIVVPPKLPQLGT
jgi:hypothetical protein